MSAPSRTPALLYRDLADFGFHVRVLRQVNRQDALLVFRGNLLRVGFIWQRKAAFKAAAGPLQAVGLRALLLLLRPCARR